VTATSKNHGIARLSIPEQIAESLQQRILSGEIGEGEQLVQEALAQEYAVSRMPVREALRQLEAAGLVAFRMHKGAVVTSVPVEQIAELFDLRVVLECDLLARALPKLTDAHLAAAGAILDQLEQAYADGEVSQWGALNWAFHQSLYVAAERVQTLALAQSVNVQTDRYIRLQLLLSHALEGADAEHRELLRLCAERAVKPTVAYLRDHIARTGATLVKTIAANREG
jgi:DNA-binding GntR family transcriptional regulator